MKVILFGPPGSGKGTQSALIAKNLKIPLIATGDIYREEIKANTELGKKANEYVKKGNLVPDEITIEILKNKLQSPSYSTGFVLDGYPRTMPQAKALEQITEIDIVIDLEIPDILIKQRLSGRLTCRKCGAIYHAIYNPPKQKGICDTCKGELYQREDEAAVEQRIEVYRKQTKPLLSYYEKKNLLKKVDGTKSIEDVFEQIFNILRQLKQ